MVDATLNYFIHNHKLRAKQSPPMKLHSDMSRLFPVVGSIMRHFARSHSAALRSFARLDICRGCNGAVHASAARAGLTPSSARDGCTGLSSRTSSGEGQVETKSMTRLSQRVALWFAGAMPYVAAEW